MLNWVELVGFIHVTFVRGDVQNLSLHCSVSALSLQAIFSSVVCFVSFLTALKVFKEAMGNLGDWPASQLLLVRTYWNSTLNYCRPVATEPFWEVLCFSASVIPLFLPQDPNCWNQGHSRSGSKNS